MVFLKTNMIENHQIHSGGDMSARFAKNSEQGKAIILKRWFTNINWEESFRKRK